MSIINNLFKKKRPKKCSIADLQSGEYCMITGTAMNPDTTKSPISNKDCFFYYAIEQDEIGEGKHTKIKPHKPKHNIPRHIAVNDNGNIIQVNLNNIALDQKITFERVTLAPSKTNIIRHRARESTISHGDNILVVGQVSTDKEGYITIIKDTKGRPSFITNKTEKEVKL